MISDRPKTRRAAARDPMKAEIRMGWRQHNLELLEIEARRRALSAGRSELAKLALEVALLKRSLAALARDVRNLGRAAGRPATPPRRRSPSAVPKATPTRGDAG